MSVKYKTTINKLPKITTTIRTLNNKKVEVGADWANAWLAGIHEYGCKIPVTPKMRSYLARQGLYLKSSTTYITIPERSFLRSGHDKYINEVMDEAELALGAVASGDMSKDTWLDAIGQTMVDKIKKYMIDLEKPKNHPYTIDKKGSSNPLVDTGKLVESITWEKK